MTAEIRTDGGNSCRLFLGNFSNGTIKGNKSKSLRCQYLSSKISTEQKEGSKAKKIIVADSTSTDMTYVGKNFGPETLNSASKSTKYCVGVYDEKTGKMRVYDTQMFHMKPYLPEEEEDVIAVEEEPRSFIDKFGGLVDAFGSKRKRTAFDKKYKNKLGDDEVKGSMTVDATFGQQQEKDRKERLPLTQGADGPAQQDTSSVLPPCNKAADRPEDVYPLEIVITSTQMDALHSLSTEFFDSDSSKVKEWKTSEKYCPYILQHATMLPIDPEPRWKRCKLLVYLHYLITLYKIKGDINKTKVFNELPAVIKAKMFDNFTVLIRKSRCKPARLKDRLASFIMVLCLHIDDFLLDMSSLIVDLHIESSKVQQILRALGARVFKRRKAGEEYIEAQLKIPLQFPKDRSKMASKRGR